MRLAVKVVLLSLVLAAACFAASPFVGEWEGAIQIPGSPLTIVVYLSSDGGSWQGSIDIPLQGISKLPLEKIVVEGKQISFALAGVPGSTAVTCELKDGQLVGSFQQSGFTFPVALTRRTVAEQEEDLEQLRKFIREVRSQWQVPGLAVGIVRGGEVIFAEGFGYRNNEEKLLVTENTLFGIGSATKAFTALWAGMLLEEGKLDLDRPIAEFIPGFSLKDDPLSAYITIRDLLTHRAGLPRYDFALIYNSELARRQIMANLSSMQRTGSFRSSFQYSNFNYIIAAAVMEEITGTSWEDAVAEGILEPLQMSVSLSCRDLVGRQDYALGYVRRGEEVERIDFWELGAAAPAGAINASILDLTKWLNFFLQDGRLGDKNLVSPSTVQLLTTPQVALSGRGERISQLSYALGWFVDSYRGHYRVYHGGTTAGFSALVAFLPDEDLGIAVLANLQGTPAVDIITQTIIDKLLGLEAVDWNGEARLAYAKQVQLLDELSVFNSSMRHQNTLPSHELAAYAGNFTHPLYGTITISQEGEELIAKYGEAEFKLEHWHYNTFIGEIDTMGRFQIPLQFLTSIDGQLNELLVGLDPFSSQNLVSFVRQEKIEKDLLATFVGKYLVAGLVVEVKAAGDSLLLVVPGQPAYRLAAEGKTSFILQGAAGYKVEFLVEEEKILLIQPNGTFEGKKL